MNLSVKLSQMNEADFKVQPSVPERYTMLIPWVEGVAKRLAQEVDNRSGVFTVEDVRLIFGIIDKLNFMDEGELDDYWPQRFMARGFPKGLCGFSRPLWIRVVNRRWCGPDYQVGYTLDSDLVLGSQSYQMLGDVFERLALLNRKSNIELKSFTRSGLTFNDEVINHCAVGGFIHWEPDDSVFFPYQVQIALREPSYYNYDLNDAGYSLSFLRYLVGSLRDA